MPFGKTGIMQDNLLKGGLKKYYGKYRGIVTRIDDPKKQGRIKAKIPSLLGEYDCNWALPCVPFAGEMYGYQIIPNPGDGVWIEFEGGNPEKPIWTGFWWGTEKMPHMNIEDEFDYEKRFMWFPGGLYIKVISKNDEEEIEIKHKKETFIKMTKEGDLEIQSDRNTRIKDKEGKTEIFWNKEEKKINITAELDINVTSKEGDINLKAENNVNVEAANTVNVEAANAVNVNAPTVTLAGGGAAVARVGDSVVAGPYSGTITGGSGKVSSG